MKKVRIRLIMMLIYSSLSLRFRPHHIEQILGKDTINKVQKGQFLQHPGKTQTLSYNSISRISEGTEVQQRNIDENYNTEPKHTKDGYYLDVEGGGEVQVRPQEDDPNIIITKPIQFNPFDYPLEIQEPLEQPPLNNQLNTKTATSEKQNMRVVESTQLRQEPFSDSDPSLYEQRKVEEQQNKIRSPIYPVSLSSPEQEPINTLPISRIQTVIKDQYTSQRNILSQSQTTQADEDSIDIPFSMDPIIVPFIPSAQISQQPDNKENTEQIAPISVLSGT